MQSLLIAGAFLFGFCATYAGMKSLLAFEKRAPFRTANWGLLMNGLNWSPVLLVVFTHNLQAIIADLAGCYLADVLVVLRAKKGKPNAVRDTAALYRRADGADVP